MTAQQVQRLGWGVVVLLAAVFYLVGLTSGDGTPPTADERAYSIKETTLCPICDGQNVLESNAPIATSIRAQIDELVEAGLSDSEIRGQLAEDFGEDVNSIPPSSGWGALVWIVPVVAAVVAAGVLLVSIRRWRDSASGPVAKEDVNLVEAARRKRR